MLRVGLTGGIACGKSHVLRRLAAAGCHVLDLDRVSRAVMAPGGGAYADVVAAFGPGILAADGSIDRAALGQRVFADGEARERLNALVHPRIRALEAEFSGRHATQPGAVVVVDGALLVEVGLHLRFDRLVVVHCSAEEQLARLVARDRLAEAEARARVAAQMSQEEKRAFAHFAVSSSGAPAGTDQRADELAVRLRELSLARPEPEPVAPERARTCLAWGAASGPSGLGPGPLLAFVGGGRGLDLQALVRTIDGERPWYRPPAGAPGDGPGPELLAPALVLWVLGERGPDLDYLLGAARSLAAALSPEPRALARACLAARLAWECALSKAIPEPAWLRRSDALAPVTHWADVAGELAWATELLAGARQARGPTGDLAGALAGLARGMD